MITGTIGIKASDKLIIISDKKQFKIVDIKQETKDCLISYGDMQVWVPGKEHSHTVLLLEEVNNA